MGYEPLRATFQTVEDMVVSAAEMVRPPERLSVSQSAEKYRVIDGLKWTNEKAPYLKEFMDVQTSPEFVGSAFVGPARTGKSECFLNTLNHTVVCDPADMCVYDMTQQVARDWSNKELKRFFHRNKYAGRRVLEKNVHDVTFRSGMTLLIKWPTITELSGKTIQRVWFRDYDRMPIDIDGEGSPYDLGSKRTETFRRFGMTTAESSPGHEIEQPKWIARTPHEAPPCKGILEIYNRGDRRRWYWKCPFCKAAFEPRFKLLNYPDSNDVMEAAEMATLRCPHCAIDIPPSMKSELNIGGRWICDGQQWEKDGSISGQRMRSDIASFWMFGPAAAFQKWSSLVVNYLRAKTAFDTTGDTGPLKKTVTADQGEAFLSPALAEGRLPEWLSDRKESWGSTKDNPTVPYGVRFLVATVDVQAGSRSSFVVQVHGYGEGGDCWLIDYFKIRKSMRLDEDGEHVLVDPAAYAEDWQVLVEKVIERTYPLDDGSGRRMQIKFSGIDSGGKEGVTTNAILFWRWLRDKQGSGHQNRFRLIMGRSTPNAPRWQITYLDSNRKDRHSGARGDVPFLLLNSNLMKDQISAVLGREGPGGGMVHFPDWTENYIFTQLTAETRTTKGWEKANDKAHNEAWDLLYYAAGICLTEHINIERIDWLKPPEWAAPWDKNSLVIAAEARGYVVQKPKVLDLKALAAKYA